ncbi:MAG: hypothetical protein P1P74_02580 [Desulfuromonadales bacterium]|nr:hypothetical protein [Desulfuromonadales bacterium]MDT8424216.1 hypothetical protein [Desulfuromonadales bacterium]
MDTEMQQLAVEIGNQIAARIGDQLSVFYEAMMPRLDSLIEGQQTLANKSDRTLTGSLLRD